LTSQVLHPLLTPARRTWLESLAALGIATRGRGRTGFNCMQIGWTKWVWVDTKTGAQLTADEVRERGHRDVKIIGEELTDAGRAILKAEP
jgi:hypothetical protein